MTDASFLSGSSMNAVSSLILAQFHFPVSTFICNEYRRPYKNRFTRSRAPRTFLKRHHAFDTDYSPPIHPLPSDMDSPERFSARPRADFEGKNVVFRKTTTRERFPNYFHSFFRVRASRRKSFLNKSASRFVHVVHVWNGRVGGSTNSRRIDFTPRGACFVRA